MGVRLILSMDPVKVSELFREQVDVDRLLVRVAEDTFTGLAERFYPGDEFGFILGIHHDARVHSQASWVQKLKAEGRYQPKEHLPHIHAHVFLLPQTKKGVRISLSNHNRPGRDGIYVNMLDEVLATYQENVQRQVYDLTVAPAPRIGPEWEPLIREASLSVMEGFFKAPPMSEIKSRRRFGLSKFAFHLGTMNKEGLRRRYHNRQQQFLQFTRVKRVETWNAIVDNYTALERIFLKNVKTRREHLVALQTNFKRSSEARTVRFWDVPSGKSLILKPAEGRLVIPANRSDIIRQSLQELDDIRKASLLQNLAEVTLMEMKLGAILPKIQEPRWINDLAQIAQLDALPHQEILDAAPSLGPRIPAEFASPPASAAPTETAQAPAPTNIRR